MSADSQRQVPLRVKAAARLADLAVLPTNVRRLPSAAADPVTQLPRRGRFGKGVLPLREQRRSCAAQTEPAAWLDLVKPAPAMSLEAREVAMVEAAKAVLKRRLTRHIGERADSSQAVRDLAYLHLASLDHERFAVAFLDAQMRLIAFEEMFVGAVNQAVVYPREVARRALACNAVSVILAHNHPSGGLDPSLADKQLTNHIQRALELLDVVVLDHVIVGRAGVMSFAERGFI